MNAIIKTVDDWENSESHDPLNSLKSESIDRMRTALLSASLGDVSTASIAIRQVTILRVSHQVTRIVQYLDLMDRLENKLFQAVDNHLNSVDLYDPMELAKLLKIQEQLQKSIIESNKLLAPYLEMEQYPAFTEIEEVTPASENRLAIPAADRNALRESAGEILLQLNELSELDEA